ncbi:Ribosomal RNA small subunit methyltransferase J [Thalassocella blandensis]|nr:Ribosomal RNA small subunit methyltransferase J [Thalassocella blandensis]
MKQKKHDTTIPVLQLCCPSVLKREMADRILTLLDIPHIEERELQQLKGNKCVLVLDERETRLDVSLDKQNMSIKVDLVEGKAAYRRLHGGGRGQLIAKAVGINKAFTPSVLDCTAGMAGDAFVLASLGCKVQMLERSLLSATLLSDGLLRGRIFAEENEDEELGEVLSRLSLLQQNSIEYLDGLDEDQFDVIYLDPMFPERKKSAAVKKEMRVFHHYIGADEDADALLQPALQKARFRVVVKRPSVAPFLAEEEPSYQIKGKSTRFDIYTRKAIPTA